MSTDYAVGIDLGGTNIKLAAVTRDGTILEEAQFSTGAAPGFSNEIVEDQTPGRSHNEWEPEALGTGASGGPGERRQATGLTPPPAWAVTIRREVEQLQLRQGRPAGWVGLAAPGLAARDTRSIAFLPGRLPGMQGLDWTMFLQSSSVVPVLNDTHAALLGETWKGAAVGLQDVALLTLGTGVGGAILADGRLLRGHIGRAGHLGHLCLDPDGAPDICGTPGSLEDAIGECTLARRSGGRYRSTTALVAAFRSGDGEAAAVWIQSVRALACGIATLINILDPEAVVIGGGIAQAGAALFEPLEKFLDEVEWRPGGHRARIIPASLGEYAGALGAASYAMRQ